METERELCNRELTGTDTTYSEVLSVFKRLVPIPTTLKAEVSVRRLLPLIAADHLGQVQAEHQECTRSQVELG